MKQTHFLLYDCSNESSNFYSYSFFPSSINFVLNESLLSFKLCATEMIAKCSAKKKNDVYIRTYIIILIIIIIYHLNYSPLTVLRYEEPNMIYKMKNCRNDKLYNYRGFELFLSQAYNNEHTSLILFLLFPLFAYFILSQSFNVQSERKNCRVYLVNSTNS